MTVTKDIVRDLLPVYLAGEASADTQALVEAFLAHDDELRALLESARAEEIPRLPGPDHLEELELKSLDRTRGLLGRKSWLLGVSLFFSLIPWSVVVLGGRKVFFMARDLPVLSAISLIVGLAGWVAFLDTCRRLNVRGLDAPRSWFRRLSWWCLSIGLGFTATEVLKHWTGEQGWILVLVVGLFGGGGRWLGERWRQIPTYDELHRPTTLFKP